MRANSFDHTARWVGDPAAVARVLLDGCGGLREIEAREAIRAGGRPIERGVDAETTRAVFVRAAEGVAMELVEHRSSLSPA